MSVMKQKKWARRIAALLSMILVLGTAAGAAPVEAQAETPAVGEVSEQEVKVANVAVYGTAYADSTQTAYGAQEAFLNDGNLKSLWIAATSAAPVSAGVTLDREYEVQRVRVVFETPGSDTFEQWKSKARMAFKASYKKSGSSERVDFWTSDRDYTVGHEDEQRDGTIGRYVEYVFDEPVKTSDIQITITKMLNGTTIWPAIEEIEIYAEDDGNHSQVGRSNVALHKPVTADKSDNGSKADYITDGNRTGSWWDSGLCPSSFYIDLQGVYRIDEMKAITYYLDNRSYQFKIYTKINERDEYEVVPSADYSENKEPVKAEGYSFSFEEPLCARFIKVEMFGNSATGQYGHIVEFEAYGVPDESVQITSNVAKGKPVEASAGTGEKTITDGVRTGSFWDGGPAPSEFEIDLGGGYFIDEFKGFTYADGDGRYYHYEIWTSLDGRKYEKAAEKTDNELSTGSGDTFFLEKSVEARYVRVIMTYNSKNPSVHMREFEVYGIENPDYVEPEAPDYDETDPDNVAFGKPARSNLANKKAAKVTDGSNFTYWVGKFYPSYVDVDLMEMYDLSEIVLNFPVNNDRYYYYTVYGSNDGSTYDRLYRKRSDDPATDAGDMIQLTGKSYRIIRVYVEYCSDGGSAWLSEVRVHGEATGKEKEKLREGGIEDILQIKDFSQTAYAEEITPSETIENVYGIIGRTVGEEYRDWFTFELRPDSENGNDYYELSNSSDGKILIAGNDGVSLAAGLNYYYKNYCNVNISEQANQTEMPDEIAEVDGKIRRETPYEIRYAFNYCTMDYSFAFFGEEDFQKEYDWLALNGVNVVLDLAGQEAVWIKFLMNFGYTFDEAKDWIAGPSYYAWQFMDNMEIFGGPVSDRWIVRRLEMARKNQRWKRSLGMDTVLQGYAGMIPTNFSEYQSVDILKQGGWCGLDRPDMIRTDGSLYDEYAKLFYEAQKWAFGDTTDYYAADPFHEGGIRPADLSDDTIAKEVLESLLQYDENAVWMVQAWWNNPTNELLQGMGQYRQDHVIILDLTGLEAPKWNKTEYGTSQNNLTKLDSKEFNGTDWVWCMLENYGGNPSMDGQIEKIATDVPEAYAEAEHMKGIGIISEATLDNPVIYDLVFDMAWETTAVDIDDWLDKYVVRRYGAESEDAREAWNILKTTVYNRSGNTNYTLARLPENVGTGGLPYNAEKLEKAFKLLLNDFEKLSSSEAYLYDLTEIMRQLVNNYGVIQYNKVIAAFEAKDLEAFRTERDAFLNAFDVCDLVQGTQKEQLAGEWIGKAADWAKNDDDFSYDSLTMNAKALITTWAGATSAAALPDYAYRNYQGMMTDLYKARWQTFLKKEEANLESEAAVQKLTQADYFHFYWNWVMNTPEYTRVADNSPEHVKEVAERLLKECSVIEYVPENDGNIALDKPVTTTRERADSPGAPGGGYAANVNDGSTQTYWDGDNWKTYDPCVTIDLKQEYVLDKINVVPYFTAANRYYLYTLYTSVNGSDWDLLVQKTSQTPQTIKGDTFDAKKVVARYIKLEGTYNNHNEGFHITEIRAYGAPYVAEDIDYSELEALLAEIKELKQDNYTDESWAGVTEVLTQTEDYLAGRETEKRAQEIIDARAEELKAAFEAAKAALAVKPIEIEETMYTVYVKAGEGEIQTAETGVYNTRVTLKEEDYRSEAGADEEAKFLGWKEGDGIISTQPVYTFYIAGDITLSPVYENPEETQEIEAAALMANVIVSPGTDTKVNVKFVGQLVIPDGCRLVQAGLIWGLNKTAADLIVNEEKRTIKNGSVTVVKTVNKSYQYSVTLNGLAPGKSLVGKVYMYYLGKDGKYHWAFSEVTNVVNSGGAAAVSVQNLEK